LVAFTLFRRVRHGLVVGLIVGLFASALVNFRPSTLVEQSEAPSGLSAWIERAEFALFDLRMRLHAQSGAAQAPIAFVNVDEESLAGPLAARRPWPWKRAHLADLVAELNRLGARAIVIEPEFLAPRATVEEERAFAKRLAASGNVILGFAFTELKPEPSPTLGRFAFAQGSFDTREAALAQATRLIERPRDAVFLIEEAGRFTLWRGGFTSQAEARSAAMAHATSAPQAPTPASAPPVRELTTRETFLRVTRDLVFAETAAMDHPDLSDFPATFRSLRTLPLPLMIEGIHFGAMDLDPEFDGVVRRVRPVIRADGKFYPSVALTAARLLHKDTPAKVTRRHLLLGDKAFALDDQGRLGLRFYGEPTGRRRAAYPYPEISARSVFNSAERHAQGRVTERHLQESVAGRVVFLSRTASSLHAAVPTPVGDLGSSFAWAMALEDLLRGVDIARAQKSFDGWLTFAMALAGGLVTALCMRLLRRKTTIFLCASVSLCLLASVAFYLEQAWGAGRWVSLLLPVATYLLACALTNAVLLADGMRAVGAIWDALGRSLPVKNTEQLIQRPNALTLDGAHHELTLWLFDLRGFSTWSAALDPKTLVKLMNELWTALSDEICHTNGQLDRVMGDGLFAYWGMPLANRRHALDACRCALAVRTLIERRGKSWKKRYGVDIEGAMALSGGQMVAGNFGFGGERPRVNYTVMGRPLGEVKRLEAMSERWGNRILMTDEVHAQVEEQVESRLIGAVRLSERSGETPRRVYELLALKGGLTREARALLTQYQQAQAATEKRQFAEAAEILKAILAKEPADLPSQVLLARCEQSLKMPPPETWSGVFEVR